MGLKVYIPELPDSSAIEHLRPLLDPALHVDYGPLPDPPEYEILVAGFPSAEELTASEALRVLIIPWAGFSVRVKRLLGRVEKQALAVHNIHHNAPAVAESAVAYLMAVSKRLLPFDRLLRQNDWTPRFEARNDALLLQGRKALVLGYGSIGRRVAQMLSALGMEVRATRSSIDAPEDDGEIALYPASSLEALLPEAQALIITLPLTDQTRDLLGSRELALLPSDCVLVNVARSRIVEEKALYELLEQRKIFGAALDVWYRYPATPEVRSRTAPSDYPFHGLDNVLMSPHRSGHCDGNERRRAEQLAQLLNAAARGEEIPNRVDVQRGY